MTGNDKTWCEIGLTVPFSDLDPMQVVWHGNYIKYFDQARFALFNQVGIDLYQYYLEEKYLFPVTKTTIKYVFPLKYGDAFICRAKVLEARIKIVLDFEIRLAETGKICVKGKADQVAVSMPDGEMMLEIPEKIQKAFGF
jgi:acyl-CoA thioester hydrolase